MVSTPSPPTPPDPLRTARAETEMSASNAQARAAASLMAGQMAAVSSSPVVISGASGATTSFGTADHASAPSPAID